MKTLRIKNNYIKSGLNRALLVLFTLGHIINGDAKTTKKVQQVTSKNITTPTNQVGQIKPVKVNINSTQSEYARRIEEIAEFIPGQVDKKIEEASLLLAIVESIKQSELFPHVAVAFHAKKDPNNEHFNCLLILKLVKKHLFNKEYKNPQSLENALDMYNTSVKLKFVFKVRKINTTNGDDVDMMNNFVKQQKSSDFDLDKFASQLEAFMNKFDKQEVFIPYNEMDFIPNIGHRQIPNEYREAQQLLKTYKYFIFARDKKANGTYVYYIAEGLEEGTEVTLSEFETLEQNRLFYLWLIKFLKKNDIRINGLHIMKYVDDVVAYQIFKA